VNDGSTDKTADLVREAIVSDPSTVLIEHPVNRGYGAALKSGLRSASKSLIFFTDSDLQFDISELEKLLPWIDQYPIVIGYREKRKDHFFRKMMAWGWGILIRVLFNLKGEILIRARKKGFSIMEIPVAHFPRRLGVPSGARPRIILRAFREMLKLYRELK
jgi:glycosyltransferase involved in cell wall biosynthesis